MHPGRPERIQFCCFVHNYRVPLVREIKVHSPGLCFSKLNDPKLAFRGADFCQLSPRRETKGRMFAVSRKSGITIPPILYTAMLCQSTICTANVFYGNFQSELQYQSNQYLELSVLNPHTTIIKENNNRKTKRLRSVSVSRTFLSLFCANYINSVFSRFSFSSFFSRILCFSGTQKINLLFQLTFTLLF